VVIIYPYRNRDLNHVQNSLNSLKNQTYSDFKVFFVDYGSTPDIAEKVKNLCETFSFVTYRYYNVQYQPWNKSRALNSAIKNFDDGFCFVADIDMIFRPDFIEKAIGLQESNKCIYFQVGFLSPDDKVKEGGFQSFKDFRKSTYEATGLSMIPVKALRELRGYDEFYHFWGAEDSDMHVRLKNYGFEVEYYDNEILMLHQWHPSYRSKEISGLSSDLQVRGIVQLNHQHLKSAILNKTTKINPNKWGEILLQVQMEELLNAPISLEITNKKFVIRDLLYGHLPNVDDEIIKIKIHSSSTPFSFNYRFKKLLNKKVPVYYSLKEVNDLVLLHLISFYRNFPYYYRVSSSQDYIEFAIKL